MTPDDDPRNDRDLVAVGALLVLLSVAVTVGVVVWLVRVLWRWA